MTDRGESKRIGDAGEAVVKSIIATDGQWIAREQHIDIGIDLEAEVDEAGAFGQFLKIQVKATSEPPPARTPDATTSISVSKTFLQYAQECRLPVVLVRIWLEDQSASFVWIQEWIEANRDSLALDRPEPKTVPVSVRLEDDLRQGLSDRLKQIARGATALQFRLTLRELARWAVVHRSEAAVQKLGELLVALGNERDAPVGALIDEMVTFSTVGLERGQVRGTWEYRELVPILLQVCRAFGQHFTHDQVVRLVVRPDGFSRIAMHGLALLYDMAAPHMKSLGLPQTFDQLGQQFLAFYCRLRERYLGTESIRLVMGDMVLTANGGAVVRADDFRTKWANRGDAAFYDFWKPG